jgi:hypothetical protein
MLRELRSTTINGQIYLFPVPVVKDRKYLILCKSHAEAELVAKAVAQERLTHPDLVSDHFIYIAHHTDKQTKIMALNPKFNISDT